MVATEEAFTEIFTSEKPTSSNRQVPRAPTRRALRRGAAELLVDLGVQAPGVHADADRHAAIPCLARDQSNLLGLSQVARIEAQPLHARLERGEGHLHVEVNVGHDRHRRARTIWARPSAASRSLQVQRTMSARPPRARRSARACLRRRPSWWWSSTAPIWALTADLDRPDAYLAVTRRGLRGWQ